MADTAQNEQRTPGFATLKAHVIAHKVEFGLWATRLMTIFFCFNYFIPLFTGNAYQCFYKALMANAATSALRLHQRLPRVSLTREFLAQLLAEDSAHYLVYSLIFLYAQPMTIALLPCALFAVLHAASYSLTLLDLLGQNSWWGARMLISLVELQSRNILRMAAFSEIFLMPLVVLFVFFGRVSLVTPFMYYRFLGLRYASRRNPYTRSMFHELRLALEEVARNPRFPEGARNLVHKFIEMVSRFAPVQEAPAQ